MKLKIDKPIRLIELFAGIGSQAKALERLGADFEHYRICEFDKYAIKSYNAIHGTNFEISDITKITAEDLGIVDTDKFCYIMTYSFPCQDLSLAGKGKGMAKGDNTRSGLLWEVERLLNECEELPQILLMENVTQVHGKKNKEHFEEWIQFLESKGYSNYWQDLNAKNFGIPQNRNRTFMVSVLGDYTYEFPEEFPLALRLKDMLETEVDEKFYLTNDQMGKIVNWKAQQKPFERVLGRESVVQTITARGAGENHSGMIVYSSENENTTNMQAQVKEMTHNAEPKLQKVCQLGGSHEQSGRVYSDNGIAPTIMSNSHGKTDGGYTSPKIAERFDPFICASRGRNPENPSDRRAGIPTEQRLEANFSGCSNTLTTVQKDNYVVEPFINKIDIPQVVRVRKYEVDCKLLCATLRVHKQASNLSNKEIAEQLNIPLTNVEHWFRQDNGFSIPDANIWFALKKLLGVETDKFDEAITTYEEKEGVFEKSNRCYLSDGIAPTITSASAAEKVLEPIINVVGNYSPSGHDASRIVDRNGLAPTVKENHGTVTDVVEPLAYDEQNGYIRKDGIVGTLTTDGSSPKHNNRVVEPLVWDGYNQRIRKEEGTVGSLTTNCGADLKRNGQGIIEPIVCEQRTDEGLRFFKGDYCGALRTIDACGDKRVIENCTTPPPDFRIRKLTPKECWRLMGFDDADFEKAAAEISNTQLYKQAGNSIVVDVLYYIFRNMLGGA